MAMVTFGKAEKQKVEDYVRSLRELSKSDPERARREAKEALIRTGVLNKDGSPKENIVTRAW